MDFTIIRSSDSIFCAYRWSDESSPQKVAQTDYSYKQTLFAVLECSVPPYGWLACFVEKYPSVIVLY